MFCQRTLDRECQYFTQSACYVCWSQCSRKLVTQEHEMKWYNSHQHVRNYNESYRMKRSEIELFRRPSQSFISVQGITSVTGFHTALQAYYTDQQLRNKTNQVSTNHLRSQSSSAKVLSCDLYSSLMTLVWCCWWQAGKTSVYLIAECLLPARAVSITSLLSRVWESFYVSVLHYVSYFCYGSRLFPPNMTSCSHIQWGSLYVALCTISFLDYVFKWCHL